MTPGAYDDTHAPLARTRAAWTTPPGGAGVAGQCRATVVGRLLFWPDAGRGSDGTGGPGLDLEAMMPVFCCDCRFFLDAPRPTQRRCLHPHARSWVDTSVECQQRWR